MWLARPSYGKDTYCTKCVRNTGICGSGPACTRYTYCTKWLGSRIDICGSCPADTFTYDTYCTKFARNMYICGPCPAVSQG